MPPVYWYTVNKEENIGGNYLRKYVTKEIIITQSQNKIAVEIGVEENCEMQDNAEKICNGPLKQGTNYR